MSFCTSSSVREGILSALALLVLWSTATDAAERRRRYKLVGEPPDTLEAVIVWGERIERADRPRSTTVVDLGPEEVQRFLPQTSSDALVSAPGVDLVKIGPWASTPSVRGLSGDRVLVLVDGVRMNTARGHGADPSLITADRLEGIELSLGAESATHGSSALGGVVNLRTHRPLLQEQPELEVTLGVRQTAPERAQSQKTVVRLKSRNAGLEVRGRLGSLEALRTPERTIPNSGFREEEVVVRGAGRWGHAYLDVEHSVNAARDIGLPAFATPAGGDGLMPLRGRTATRLELRLDDLGTVDALTLRAVRQNYETAFIETTVDSVFVRRQLVATRTNVSADDYTTVARTLRAGVELLDEGPIELFAELHHEDTAGPRETEVTTRNRVGVVTDVSTEIGEMLPPATRLSGSVGARGRLDTPVARIESAVRYDRFDSDVDSTEASTRPSREHREERGSVQAGLSRDVRLPGVGLLRPYGNVSTGFRAPNLDERYFDGFIHGWLRVFGNQTLIPEKSTSYEIGFRLFDFLGGHLERARISAYWADVEDMITLQYVGQLYLVPRFQHVNIRRARLRGLEGDVRLRVGGARLELGFGLPEGIDQETGEPLTDVGADRLVVSLLVPLERWLPEGSFALRARWHGAVRNASDVLEHDGFSTASAQLSARLFGLRTTLAVKNLFDADYRESLSLIPESGRVFAISVESGLSLPLGTSEEGS